MIKTEQLYGKVVKCDLNECCDMQIHSREEVTTQFGCYGEGSPRVWPAYQVFQDQDAPSWCPKRKTRRKNV
jgi:hypothetical protein